MCGNVVEEDWANIQSDTFLTFTENSHNTIIYRCVVNYINSIYNNGGFMIYKSIFSLSIRER